MTAPHPAPFSDAIIQRLSKIVHEYAGARTRVTVLDPFAGIGGIHKIPDILGNVDVYVDTYGIEREPAWACAHPRTREGSALDLPFKTDRFDFIVTSPCYGNRMADHHNAKDGSRRITYRHYYGEELHEDNAGTLQWGHVYRDFHKRAWVEAKRVLKPNGIFVVNISNHIRKGEVQHVVEWHLRALMDLGLLMERVEQIATPRMRNGANANLRVPCEHILVMRNG